MAFSRVNGIDIYHEEHGPTDGASRDGSDARTVLNITGSGNDLRLSNPGRHPLNKHFRTIHFDQRGLGQTSKPHEQWTMADYADDAVGLLDWYGIERAHVVGTSFGGMVAQHLALRYPARVGRLVLACSASGGAGGASADLLAIAKLPPAEAASTRLNLMDRRWTTPDDVEEPLASLFALRAERTKSLDDDAVRGARMQLVARADHDTWDDLHRIDHETLIIGGTYDQQAPPENLQNLRSRLSNSALEFFDGGHFFFIQDRTAWPRVVEFLSAPA